MASVDGSTDRASRRFEDHPDVLKRQAPRGAGRRITACSGRGRIGRVFLLAFRGLAEALAERSQLEDLGAVELVVSVFEILYRPIEPLALILGSRSDHPAPDDVLKHLIAGLIERALGLDFLASTIPLFGHELWVRGVGPDRGPIPNECTGGKIGAP